MEHKAVNFVIQGMQSDTAPSRADSKFAYENMNIRMTAMADKTLLAITNEKGNKKLEPKEENSDRDLIISGNYVGHCVVGKYLVIFTTNNDYDRIYRFYLEENTLYGKLIHYNHLNLSEEHPLETLGIYENEEIQKVYWVDGINPIRSINIANDKYKEIKPSDKISTIFDFSGDIPYNQTITVIKDSTDNGIFSPGVIQYAYSFFDKYGRESAIVDVTSLYYITHNDRGANPEDICRNSFKISINNINNKDYKYDYVRLYAIHRSSINGAPSIRVVADLKLNLDIDINNVSYIDKGTSGALISATELLFKGGDFIIANTIDSKDNTLFIGNFKNPKNKIPSELKSELQKVDIFIAYKQAELLSEEGKFYTHKFQLHDSLNTISTYKQGETYRFGVQLQDKRGKWSEAVFIKDVEIPYNLSYEGNIVKLIKPSLIINESLKNLLKDYIKIRGVVVFPSNIDRTIISQGMLCPTVFNLASRCNKGIYSQSSWFARPFAPEKVSVDNDLTSFHNCVNGSVLEFRHEYIIPADLSKDKDNKYYGSRNIEIGVTPYIKNSESNPNYLIYKNLPSNPWGRHAESFKEETSLFYVDQSIVTFHSPEFYFTKEYDSIENEDVKLRIVGYIPLTAFTSEASITTQSAGLGADNIRTFIKREVENKNVHGYKAMCSELFYVDAKYDSEYNGSGVYAYLINPWHRNGSLNDTPKNISSDKARTAVLKRKVLSNIKFSNNTEYFNTPWEALVESNTGKTRTGITQVKLFNSETLGIVKIPRPKNCDSKYKEFIYKGNIDMILNGYNNILAADSSLSTNVTTKDINAKITELSNDSIDNYSQDPVSMKYKSTPHAVFAFNYTDDGRQVTLPYTVSDNRTLRNDTPVWYERDGSNMDLYPFTGTTTELNSAVELYSIGPDLPSYEELYNLDDPDKVEAYSTTDKAFYSCKGLNTIDKTVDWVDMTSSYDENTVFKILNNGNYEYSYYVWRYITSSTDAIYSDYINVNSGYGGFYLAELYRDIDNSTRFGGNTEEQIEYNIWYPAGSAVNIDQEEDIIVEFTEGDTFYQRFDCLKTYPYTNEDQNSIVEIVSFMCENRLNIDGRYDRNRGLSNNTTITNTNFNLYNDVYNQSNNYFNYTTSVSEVEDYINTITWTLPKSIGEKIDTWTNITLASTLSLDGNKGKLNKIQVHNNDIILFQDKAISKLLFNSRVQIPIADGVPIEIANSGKVDGNVYVTYNIGTVNKWSIVSSPNGIYFVDNYNQGIYLFDGNRVQCISDILNMSSFIKTNNSLDPWNPKHFNNIRTFYDGINNDIYFINDKKCLCYSELLGQFTSYFNYENVPMFVNLDSKLLSYKDNTLWEQFAGEYNEFYGEIKPFYTTIISNPEPIKDKIFNSIDFRSDTYSDNTLLNKTFDTLEVWNEYQKGKSKLANILGRPSNLKQKFRIWRVQIPRHNNTLQRIRNPWCYIKLSMETPSNYKTVLHDITVNYTV